jgi:hypothetical protein
MSPRIVLKAADAISFPCDVLILKYARYLYGLDRAVFQLLTRGQEPMENLLPDIGSYAVFNTNGKLSANQVMFIGTNRLGVFHYNEIRLFARQALEFCASKADKATTIALTLHGVNYGLDEKEALYAEIIGLSEAISSGKFPRSLQFIYILERDEDRAHRLLETLQEMADPLSGVPLTSRQPTENDRKRENASIIIFDENTPIEEIRRPGEKPSIFVAMPFLEEMSDVFYFGIQKPIEQEGYLCERADLSVFTGDVMDWVRKKIVSSELVVADLTGANPNVYLEVGLAWGMRKPTILLLKSGSELKFDVRSQRCLVYNTIKDLEGKLLKEMKVLLGKQ